MRLLAYLLLDAALCVQVSAAGDGIRTVYVFSATHFDTTFTGPPPFSYARNYRILDAVLKLAQFAESGF